MLAETPPPPTAAASPPHALPHPIPQTAPGSPAPDNDFADPAFERRARPRRACTTRPRREELPPPPQPPPKRVQGRRDKDAAAATASPPAYRVITPLVEEPAPAELPRWQLRGMWELASVLNFLNVFWPMLHITGEFNAEELESALITPNSILADIHMPLLKAIPPVTRMALGHATWVTVLCRKLRDWWHWVAEGDLPIVASHGSETESYNALDPATRLLILKAICDIRVEQEDIRNYIDSSIKHGCELSAFRKERIGGDSYGISFWYEGDPAIGHRLYREIREKRPVEVKKVKSRQLPLPPSFLWETVATNFDEFQEVADKLFSSQNKSEMSLGKKLKIDYIPDIEKIHKKKEKLLKKQQREALLLDSYLTATDGISSGRSLRDRKPVTYTFDDYDRSINEAIKITKKGQNPPEVFEKKALSKPEALSNGTLNGVVEEENELENAHSPKSDGYEETAGDGSHESDDDEQTEPLDEPLDRSNRRRKRTQKYMDDFVGDFIADYDPNYESDDDIVGEVVYDDDYLKRRKQRSDSSVSEEDEEFKLEEEVADDDEEEEEEYVVSTSEDKEEQNHRKRRRLPPRGRRKERLRSVREVHTGPRRSTRSTRPRISYRHCDVSDSDQDSRKRTKSSTSESADDYEQSSSSRDQGEEHEEESDGQEECSDKATDNEANTDHKMESTTQQQSEVENKDIPPAKDEAAGRRFLDLNEMAPGGGFDDGPSVTLKDENMDNV